MVDAEPEPILIALGSNIEPKRHLRRAVRRLAAELDLRAVSHVYQTPAVGTREPQPDYLNAAVLVDTDRTATALKHEVLRPLEAALGRTRGPDRYAPRVIDLDLALYGARRIDDPAAGLQIPDPDSLRHAHIALPLADLAPRFVHPVAGRPLADIAAELAATPGLQCCRWQLAAALDT